MDDKMERKKLLEYLPDFMKQFLEMKEIMQTEDKEMDIVDSSIKKVLDNAFIEDCDEIGIKKYETLLGIVPNPKDTIESRRSMVLLYWNSDIFYTYRELIHKLNKICESHGYELDADLENYNIQFNIYSKVNITDIESFLEKVLPQNIRYDVYCATANSTATHTGIIWQDDEIFNLRQVII